MLFPQVTYPVVVWGLYAGIAAAAIGTTVSRFRSGKAVRTLIDSGATSPENAKTAVELELTGGARRSLCGTLYGKLFFCANEDEATLSRRGAHSRKDPYAKPRLDMSKARFYLPKDKEYQATERFPRPSVAALAVGLVILTAIFAVLHFFLPSLISNVVSSFKG